MVALLCLPIHETKSMGTQICQQSLLVLSQSKPVCSLEYRRQRDVVNTAMKRIWIPLSNIDECKIPYQQGCQCSMPRTCANLPSMKSSQQSAYKQRHNPTLISIVGLSRVKREKMTMETCPV